jgi:hypothetical protein
MPPKTSSRKNKLSEKEQAENEEKEKKEAQNIYETHGDFEKLKASKAKSEENRKSIALDIKANRAKREENRKELQRQRRVKEESDIDNRDKALLARQQHLAEILNKIISTEKVANINVDIIDNDNNNDLSIIVNDVIIDNKKIDNDYIKETIIELVEPDIIFNKKYEFDKPLPKEGGKKYKKRRTRKFRK